MPGKRKQTANSVISDMKVPAGLVDQPCSEEHLRELSQHVGNEWENIVGFLGFENPRTVIDAIKEKYPGKMRQQVTEMFLQWRDLGKMVATYRKLIEVLVDMRKIRLAETVCEILHPVAPDGEMRGGEDEVHHQSTGEEEPDVPAPLDSTAEEGEVKSKVQPIRKEDLDKVEILLVVITEPENDAVMEKLEEPKQATLSAAGTDITLGRFGGYHVALLHARMGYRCERPVRETLKALKNVDKVIAIGIAYGAYRGKQELGDVLVSRSIEYGDVKHSDVTSARGPRMETDPKLDDIFCKSLGSWSGKAFHCEGSRYSVVHLGLIASSNNLWNSLDEKEKLQEAYKNQKFIGGEMEGGFICQAAQEAEENEPRRGRNGKIAVIVIKSVSDYADGKKGASKKWQPIAAKAAASYTLHKLRQYKQKPTVGTHETGWSLGIFLPIIGIAVLFLGILYYVFY